MTLSLTLLASYACRGYRTRVLTSALLRCCRCAASNLHVQFCLRLYPMCRQNANTTLSLLDLSQHPLPTTIRCS